MIFSLLLAASIAVAVCGTSPQYVVDLTDITSQSQLSVQSCAGLMNRNAEEGFTGVYTLLDKYDYDWLADIEGVTDPQIVSLDSFLRTCLSTQKAYIKYDFATQQALIPNLITMAGVMGAVPVDAADIDSVIPVAGAAQVFDATVEWAGFEVLEATEYVYDRFVNDTTTLAFLNPGFDNAANPQDPPLTGSPDLGLTDYLVKEKIFTIFLWNGCVEKSDQYDFMYKLTTQNPWPRPIPVYGYNDAWPVAGDIFEAETNCNDAHNMGQIASAGVNDLSYLSRKVPVSQPVPQNPVASETYNSSTTYVMFVMGDGDNVHFVEQSRRDWMQQRVDRCAADPSYLGCFPLSWSLSPHLTHLAPDWMHWYYNKAAETGHDYFMLPPCGDLYSYPAEMPGDVQDGFVANTEQDCQLMSTSGSVEWEWIAHWNEALQTYFPKYSANNIVRGLFTVNVPFNLPAPTIFDSLEYYKIVAGNVVVFKPREWRGTDSGDAPLTRHNFLSVEQMATELNSLPKGTVTWIYMTSDGGAGLEMMYDLVPQLEEHVQVVSHETLIDLALQRG